MKILIGVVMLFIIGCNTSDKKENFSITGAYKMLWQNIKSDSTDTTYSSLQQMKIFTDDYMMYANVNPTDSTSGFGIGTYIMDKDTVTENVFYNASDTTKNETGGTFKLGIEKTDKGYKQTISDMFQGQRIKLTEEYESYGKAATSSLDGAWKQTKSYYAMGKDTIVSNNLTQFKIYYAGHVIWGNTYTDSAKKINTAVGFGTFIMNGNNKIKESMTSSNIYQVRGQNFDLDIELNGTDGYTQTIHNKDGSKSVEIYERLKK